MESYLFADVEAAADTMVVEGYHKPGSLTRSSGAWIHAAGTAMFEAGRRPIKPHDQWIWFAVEAGEATLVWQGPVHQVLQLVCRVAGVRVADDDLHNLLR